MRKAIFFSLLLLFLGSCSSSRRSSTSNTYSSARIERSSSNTNVALRHAQKQLGAKYKYGGTEARRGYDCSGLVYSAYRQAGVQLPRTSREMARVGEKINTSKAKPGDLVFFSKGGRIFHVAMISSVSRDELRVIHSTSSRGVIEEDIMISSYWRPKLTFVRTLR